MDKKEYISIREQRKQIPRELARSINHLLQQLDHLKEDDRTAIIALFNLGRSIGLVESIWGRRNPDLFSDLNSALNDFAPEIPWGPQNQFEPFCVDEMIAYGIALANCEKDDKPEEECPDSWEASAELTACTMRELEKRWGDGIPGLPGFPDF